MQIRAYLLEINHIAQRKDSVIIAIFIPIPENGVEIGQKELFQWFPLKNCGKWRLYSLGGIPRSLCFRKLWLCPCFKKTQGQVDIRKRLGDGEKDRTTGPGPGMIKKENGILCC